MDLKGNFETSSLAGILQLLRQEDKIGILRLTNETGYEVKIFIENGSVVYARGERQGTRLGNILKNKGILSSEQLEACMEVAKDNELALGNLLVSKGYITQETLKSILHKLGEQVILNVFLWERGQFEYSDSQAIPKGPLLTKIDIMQVLLDATRLIDEMSVFKQKIKSDQVALKVSKDAGGREDIKLTGVQWRFLTLIDGRRTVRQMIDETGYYDFAAYKVLHSLMAAGLVEEGDLPPPSTEAAVKERCADLAGPYMESLQLIYTHLERELGKWPFTVLRENRDRLPPTRIHNIRQLHESELRKWVRAIMNEAKTGLSDAERAFLEHYAPGEPKANNVRGALQPLVEGKEPDAAVETLGSGLRHYVAGVLDRLLPLLGTRTVQAVMADIKRGLPDLDAVPANQGQGDAAILAIRQTVQAFERKMMEEKVVHKSSGLFAITLDG